LFDKGELRAVTILFRPLEALSLAVVLWWVPVAAKGNNKFYYYAKEVGLDLSNHPST